MKIAITTQTESTPDPIFVAPYAFSSSPVYGQPGSLIFDYKANPIWFRPTPDKNIMNTDFRVQTYNGTPATPNGRSRRVLTFWQGTLSTPPTYTNLPGGSSEPGSCYYILDQHYEIIKTVSSQRGYTADIHEFLLTPGNTALFFATKVITLEDGTPIQNFSIQEIDLETNELTFFWNAFLHIPIQESYQPKPTDASVWDVYHLNSVGLTENKNEILVSSRNTWTIYKIAKDSGTIIWRLGGKFSDFKLDTSFSWQHDARQLKSNIISMFDDNCCESDDIPPGTPYAHGLILKLNFKTMTGRVQAEYYHDPKIQVASQGNLQSLADGHKFIGWGQSQYFSEYLADGQTVYNAKMPGSNYTYRAYKFEWHGYPKDPIKVVIENFKLYVSWNGTTETKYWKIYHRQTSTQSCLVTKKGFETTVNIDSRTGYFWVEALDKQGCVLGKSEVVSNKIHP